MKKELPSLKDVVKEVRRVARQDPTRTYLAERANKHAAACRYYPTKKNPEGCIIGKAYRNLGVDVTKGLFRKLIPIDALIADWREASVGKVVGPDSPQDARRLRWLTYVQEAQDARRPWKDAVKHANETSPNVR